MLDSINRKIIHFLALNARVSITSLSKAIHLSMPAVSGRIKKLESEGIIEGYKPLLNLQKCGFPIQAMIECNAHKAKGKELEKILMSFDNTLRLYKVTGDIEFVAFFAFKDVAHLNEVREKILKYGDTSTKLIMSTLRDNCVPQDFHQV